MSTAVERRPVPVLTICLAIVVVVVTVLLAVRGWSYYRLSMEARADHVDARTLSPFGKLGNGYGWIAALLVLVNLSYLLRRMLAGSKLGSMTAWLDIHVFTGLIIAVLVAFHSAFQLATPAATISLVSMLVVVVTGLMGRFLSAIAPSGARDRFAIACDEIEAELPGMRDDLVATIRKRPGPAVPANASLARSLAAIPAWRKAGVERRVALEMILPRPSERTPGLKRACKHLLAAAAADARAQGVTALLRSWRGLHRFFALLMVAAVVFHAGMAGKWGYWWW